MRTLDRADGEVELEYGLMDKSGRTFFDDSKSFVFDEENMPSKRKHEEIDVYYLAYGRDYFACLRDFYKLSGLFRFFQDTLLETGGAGIGNTVKKVTLSY